MGNFPITTEQLAVLQKRQALATLHPYTCPKCGSNLIPTIVGWYCENDDYTQDWFHGQDIDEDFVERHDLAAIWSTKE